MAFRQRAQSVEQSVDLREVKAQRGGFAFEDFFVFGERCLAEDERPMPLPERVEQFVRRPLA